MLVVLQQVALILVLILIATSTLLSRKIPFHALMMLCAAIMLASGVIGAEEAYAAIDTDVLLFIFGMLVLVSALEDSKVLSQSIAYLLSKSWARGKVVFCIVFSLIFGLLAAFITNDVAALIGVSVVCSMSRERVEQSCSRASCEDMLALLAVSVTVGSAMSPIGNPQNMIIAIKSGMEAPFGGFFEILGIPTILSLLVAGVEAWAFGTNICYEEICNGVATISKRDALRIAIFVATVVLLVVNDLLEIILGFRIVKHIGIVPFISASLILTFDDKREEILRNVNWGIVLFFLSMFIAVEGLVRFGLLVKFFKTLYNSAGGGVAGIILASLIISQILSNVPYVQFVAELVAKGHLVLSQQGWIALAYSSTIAGNITFFGAASNVIILEEARCRGARLGFKKFLKYSLPVTAVSLVVFLAFLTCVT